ncbi:hypothetical protein [Dyella sp. S184]|uniref:hypothetical protein n=1 Tax=Dyella sp. S184 TaxID=1641862 RepID=UPI001C207601|nr:hypothetical protein [Dyella sp. S184]
MSNVDKMCVRLLAICFLPMIIAVPIAMGISAFYNAFAQIAAPTPSLDLPWLITLVATATCLVLFAIQATRIWRWKEGKSLSCPACGCLLGSVREGRWGPYRKCLGCRTNHSER